MYIYIYVYILYIYEYLPLSSWGQDHWGNTSPLWTGQGGSLGLAPSRSLEQMDPLGPGPI